MEGRKALCTPAVFIFFTAECAEVSQRKQRISDIAKLVLYKRNASFVYKRNYE